MVTSQITLSVQSVLRKLSLPDSQIQLEHPADEKFGDYSSNVALKIKSDQFKSPRELAEKIVDLLKKDTELAKVVSKIEIAGPGFINFWINTNYLFEELTKISAGDIEIPQYHLGEKKRIMFEYAHFNTHKAVHIGHLRNISLGESLSRIFETLGNEVVRVSYGGDVGMHIAKCLYGLKLLSESPKTLTEKTDVLARAYTQGNNAYEDDEKAKQEIIAINKQIYQKDSAIMPLWAETREWSFEQFSEIYKRVNTKFDRLYYESEVFERGVEISREAIQKGILEESDGAVIFNGEKYGLDKRVFITSEGNPTYEGKELGIAEREFTQHGNLDKVIHVVAPEQQSFFKVTFRVESLLNPQLYKDKQYHFVYGYVRLTGGKMSSRKGTIVLAEWLLNEAKNRVKKAFADLSDEAAETIAVAAAKYSFLKIDARQDIAFDFDQSISLEGNSGPYLQYTYVRCQSVLKKGEQKSYPLHGSGYTLNDEELSLIRTLYKYPEVVFNAGKTFSPNLIANYLYDLAQKYNLFYQKVPVLKSEESERKLRLALTQATAQVLKNGLNLLGIDVLEKM